MCKDALDRNESCGGHFREEYQTEEGEALRDDENYAFVSAWEFKGVDQEPVLHKEELKYENIKIAQKEALMWGTHQQESIEYGNVVHEILSFVKTKNDVDLAIDVNLSKLLLTSTLCNICS